MIVRLRIGWGPRVEAKRGRVRRGALAAASLLTPAAVMACALAVWRLGADMQWTGEFAISEGLFSHWQVWIAMAAALEVCAIALNRYGRGGGLAG